jgi:hypothetical protein
LPAAAEADEIVELVVPLNRRPTDGKEPALQGRQLGR